jgi:hypothetical protein
VVQPTANLAYKGCSIIEAKSVGFRPDNFDDKSIGWLAEKNE